MWENNGWSGSHVEIAGRCSAGGGSFFSVYWGVDAFGLLTQAVDGELTARFESLYPFDPDPPQPGDIRPSWPLAMRSTPVGVASVPGAAGAANRTGSRPELARQTAG